VPTNPARINNLNTTWRFNQAFLNDEVPDQIPSPSRVEAFSFAPENFRSRTIRVLLPRGYDENTQKAYPILYAEDGQNIFAPGGAFGSWDMDITVKSMISKGEIPEIIVVGIDNSNDRFAEYTPEWGSVQGTQGRGREYLRMIRDELMAVVAERYRVATGPENTSHVGSSLGGLLGFAASSEFEDIFGAVAAMSPSTQINTNEIINEASQPPSTRSRFYMDCGTAGTSSDNYSITAFSVRDAYLESGHVYGPNFFFTIGPNQQHNEAAWKARTPEMLRWMYSPMLGSPENPTLWALKQNDGTTTSTLEPK
ncbi:MAG: alpha/beta hydrolase-fold protein, partial [Candidatus Sumerlaeota bacterium]